MLAVRECVSRNHSGDAALITTETQFGPSGVRGLSGIDSGLDGMDD